MLTTTPQLSHLEEVLVQSCQKFYVEEFMPAKELKAKMEREQADMESELGKLGSLSKKKEAKGSNKEAEVRYPPLCRLHR